MYSATVKYIRDKVIQRNCEDDLNYNLRIKKGKGNQGLRDDRRNIIDPSKNYRYEV